LIDSNSSISELFDGDHEKVKKLNKMVCDKMGFTKWQQVSGQTYTRKLDYMVLSALSGLAQSAYKMCGDIRLLASMKEIGKEYDIIISCHYWSRRNRRKFEFGKKEEGEMCYVSNRLLGLNVCAFVVC
jgi:hypothetical protein